MWCLNILINSNFLFKLIEWQHESTIMLIRIRGKQWYWVYKFDYYHYFNVLKTSFFVGRGNKITNNFTFNKNFHNTKFNKNYNYISILLKKKKIYKYWLDNFNKVNLKNDNFSEDYFFFF